MARDPLAASGDSAAWLAWLRQLVTGARARLAGVSALLAATLLLGAGALWLFGAVAENVMERETQALDDAVLAFLRQFASPTLTEVALLVSALGAQLVYFLLVVLLLLFAWQRRWGAAVSLLAVTGGAQLLNNVLKDYFHRARPMAVTGLIPSQAWSFPSGHAMVSAAFYLYLAYLGSHILRGWARAVWVAGLVVLVFLIGLSRLYLGMHYLTDVVAGYAAGVAWTAVVIVAGHALALQPPRRRPQTASGASPAGAGAGPPAAGEGVQPGKRRRTMNAAVRALLDDLLQRPGTSLEAGDMMGEQSLRVDGREVLHVHGASVLHITLPRDVKEEVLAAGLAHQHPYAPRSGGVELRLTAEDGLPAARHLAEVAFDYAVSRGQRARPAPPAEDRTVARPG